MPETPATRPGLAIFLLLSMVVLGVFPLDVVLPSFPALADYFQRTPGDIALSISLFAIGISLSQLLIGPLSDRIGRKSLLLAGMALSIVGAAGCVLSTDYGGFLLFRCLQAVGCGCFVLSQALIQDLFTGKQRDQLRILMVTASGLAISLSPLAGTVLQDAFDWPGSFWVFIALGLTVWVIAWKHLRDNPARNPSSHSLLRAYALVCRNPTFISYWLISAIAFACHFSFIVMSPLLFLEQLHLSSYTFSLILLVYGAAYVGGGVLAHGLSKRISANRQIIAGLLLIVLAGGLMGLLHRHAGLTVFNVLLPMMVCTMGITIARPIATSRAMDVFPDLAGTASSAGSALIFICGGVVSAWVNLSPASLQVTLAITFMALGLIALGLILSTRRRQRAQHPA